MKLTITHAGTTIEIEDPTPADWSIETIKDITDFLCEKIKNLQAQVKVYSETKISESELREGNRSNDEWDGDGLYSNKIGFKNT